MSRAAQEGASILQRLVALVLLPVFVVLIIIGAIIVGGLIIISGVVDVFQFVFFGTTGAISWVGTQIRNVGMWIEGIA